MPWQRICGRERPRLPLNDFRLLLSESGRLVRSFMDVQTDEYDNELRKAIAFRKSLTAESDRGCVLMAAAYIDVQLDILLRKIFVADENVAEALLGTSKPLGTFSARIDVAFLLALLSESERRDLHLIRKIRNDFAHEPSPLTFDAPHIANRCRELTFSYHKPDIRSRGHFTSAVFGLLATITVASIKAKNASPRANREITEDMKHATREAVRVFLEAQTGEPLLEMLTKTFAARRGQS